MTKYAAFLQLCAFQPGIKASPSTIITSVKILSLNVCFGNHNMAKMVLTFLGCFPNLEALHIMVFCHRFMVSSHSYNFL
jgi:hypothetical protein